MCNCRQEAVGVRRQIHSCELRLEIENGANEGRVLVREAVVFLPCPCRRLDIVERAARLSPGGFGGHLGEFGILHHHGLDDTKKRLVRGEEARTAGKGIPLEHALASVL